MPDHSFRTKEQFSDAIADQLDVLASIRRGLDQAKKGLGRPAEDVFDELERESEEM